MRKIPRCRFPFPRTIGRELAGRVGEFYTQGIPEDTSALRPGALNLEQYLEQSRIVAAEDRAHAS